MKLRDIHTINIINIILSISLVKLWLVYKMLSRVARTLFAIPCSGSSFYFLDELTFSGKGSDEVDLWLGYCAFHCGDYKRAMLEYEALIHTAASNGKKPAKVSLQYQYL